MPKSAQQRKLEAFDAFAKRAKLAEQVLLQLAASPSASKASSPEFAWQLADNFHDIAEARVQEIRNLP